MRNHKRVPFVAYRAVVTLILTLSLLAVPGVITHGRARSGRDSALRAVVDPNRKPDEPETLTDEALSLPGGDYRWQVTRLSTVRDVDAPFTVHRGVLIATSGPVSLKINGKDAKPLDTGQAQILAEGDAVLAVSDGDTPVELVVFELVAKGDVAPKEAPDRTVPLTILKGDYRLVALNLPASPFGTPTPVATPEPLADGVVGVPVLIPHDVRGVATTPVPGTAYETWLVALVRVPPAVSTVATVGTSGSTSQPASRSTTVASSDTTAPATVATTATATIATTVPPTDEDRSRPAGTGDVKVHIPDDSSGSDSGGVKVSDVIGDTVVTDQLPVNITDLPAAQILDTDGDGIPDQSEAAQGTNPNSADSDGDGTSDGDELDSGCNPLAGDTDGDRLNDSEELALWQTNCASIDTDGDGLQDYDEITFYFSNATLADTDNDGFSDWDEVMTYGTSPSYRDTDGDHLDDYREVMTFGTSPIYPDTDKDCEDDEVELASGTDPLVNAPQEDGGFDAVCP